MNGLKTMLFGLAVAVAPVALDYLAGIDPVAVLGVSPTTAAVIGAAIMVLRAITTGPARLPWRD